MLDGILSGDFSIIEDYWMVQIGICAAIIAMYINVRYYALWFKRSSLQREYRSLTRSDNIWREELRYRTNKARERNVDPSGYSKHYVEAKENVDRMDKKAAATKIEIEMVSKKMGKWQKASIPFALFIGFCVMMYFQNHGV